MKYGTYRLSWGWGFQGSPRLSPAALLMKLVSGACFCRTSDSHRIPHMVQPSRPSPKHMYDQMPLAPSDVLREWSSGPPFDGWDGIQTESQIQGSAVGQGLLSSAWELYRLLLHSCSSLQWRPLPIWSSVYLLFCASLVVIWMIEKGRSFILIRL